jgi:glycosyltransferase involved in cell wall biosynthesis
VTPAVTVVLLSYRQARFLPETLAGLAAQTFRDFDVVAVDDASGDESPELLERWVEEHPEIPARLIVHGANQGVCRTFNEAFGYVTGRYFAGLAADDVWLPDKLARQVAAFDALPNRVAVVYGDAVMIDEDGTQLPQRFLAAHGVTGPPPEGDVFARLVRDNFVPATTSMLRTSAARRAGPFDERLAYEDWDFMLRLARDNDFAFYDYVGTKYRVVSTSLTRTVTDSGLDSHARILRKCLGARPDTDDLVVDRLEALATDLWRAGHPDAAGHLGAVLRARPTPRRAVRWAAALARVPERAVRKPWRPS